MSTAKLMSLQPVVSVSYNISGHGTKIFCQNAYPVLLHMTPSPLVSVALFHSLDLEISPKPHAHLVALLKGDWLMG